MQSSLDKISIIMPAHNEMNQIRSAVFETIHVLEPMKVSYEIIVVDDHSTDDTGDISTDLAREHSTVFAYSNTGEKGKGAALQFGFSKSTGNLIMFLDADLDLHPRRIPTFLSIMCKEHADVVVGSKQHSESNIHYPFRRRVISFVYRKMLVGILFRLPVRDTQTGMKLFRRPVLTTIFPETRITCYAQDLELLVLAKRHGFTLTESPVELTYNDQQTTNITWRCILRTGWDTLRIWFRFLF